MLPSKPLQLFSRHRQTVAAPGKNGRIDIPCARCLRGLLVRRPVHRQKAAAACAAKPQVVVWVVGARARKGLGAQDRLLQVGLRGAAAQRASGRGQLRRVVETRARLRFLAQHQPVHVRFRIAFVESPTTLARPRRSVVSARPRALFSTENSP